MTFGLGNDGFTIKRESDIIDDLKTGFKAEFGEINTDPASVFGQIIGVVSKPLAELWELMELVYLSEYPASAEGISLDGVAHLTGITRLAPTTTKVIGILIGTQGTNVLTGFQGSIVDTGEVFVTLADVTIDAANILKTEISVNDVQNSQVYIVDIDAVTYIFISDLTATAAEIVGGLKSEINSGQSKVIASTDGDILTIIVDDKKTPFSVAVSTKLDLDKIGTPVSFESLNEGAILVVEGALTQIETPVAGLNEINNLDDGVIGNGGETDVALRMRRELSLRILGAATIAAIEARLLQEVENVTMVKVFENETSTYNSAIIVSVDLVENLTEYRVYINGFEFSYTSDADATDDEITAGLVLIINTTTLALSATDNADGTFSITPDTSGVIFSIGVNARMSTSGARPPKSIEAVVVGGTDVDVANKLWLVKAGGILTHGNTSEIIEDSGGDEHAIKFSRPIPKYAWADIEITLNSEEDFPADGLEQVQVNFIEFGLTLGIGDDYILQKFYAPIYDVSGIASVVLTIGVTDTPAGSPALVGTNIAIGETETLDFSDAARIHVELTP